MVMWRLAVLVAACVLCTGIQAKPVQTEIIEVSPPEGSSSTVIPESDFNGMARGTAEDAGDEPNEPVGDTPAVFEGPAPEVLYETSALPGPVARMRDQLREAALSGNIERLRVVMEGNEMPPTLSLTDIGDPIEFLKNSSGDGDGLEVLAIMIDLLEAGYVHMDAGTPQEMYVWPYFARYPLDRLNAQQKVEMYRIVTSADFAEMEAYGVWLFYRIGIGPDGTWHFFVAGE